MQKLTKGIIDGLQPGSSKHGTLFWDSELKGFGIRVFPTGLETFVVKFRTRSGRQRWLKIGTFGALTPEQARERAKLEIGEGARRRGPCRRARSASRRDHTRAAL